MSKLDRTARATYGRHLLAGETVLATADAVATGTGRVVGASAAIGALAGVLMWATLDMAALLPLVVVGGFAGTIGGTMLAAWQARRPHGPGASAVKLVLTNQRLLVLRQRSAFRTRPLRTYPLEQLSDVEASPTAIGRYQRIAINLTGDPGLRFLTRGGEDLLKELSDRSKGDT
ncbi:MAG: hypothetical protein QNJ77_13200 [Acidimicrobiia bacterium]|nr:hypothetical protein [Acidimicrobiia bacterium]